MLVSKPPAARVADELAAYIDTLETPVQLALLGPERPDLTAAVEELLGALGRPVPDWASWGSPASGGHDGLLRGLFVGGTMCDEATIIATDLLGADRCEMVDFGDDELTVGRAHPMIDPTLRLERIASVGSDPGTGVLLLDVVLGHGVQDDPAADLTPVIRALRPDLPVVVACVGTDADPQPLSAQAEQLAEAGAHVFASNAAAVRQAVSLLTDGGTA